MLKNLDVLNVNYIKCELLELVHSNIAKWIIKKIIL